MRIISGIAGSIPLAVPPDMAVRPTAERAREALFNSLGDLSGLVVWDLYAGSGALGLEALSRGARFVGFIEKEPKHCDYIEKNLAKVSTAVRSAAANIVASQVATANFPAPMPNLVLADPPYAESMTEFKLLLGLPRFREWAGKARLIWEVPDTPGALGEFLLAAPKPRTVRRFGGADFIIINFQELCR